MFGVTVGLRLMVELPALKLKFAPEESHAPAMVWVKVAAAQVPCVSVSTPVTVSPAVELTVAPGALLLMVRLLKLNPPRLAAAAVFSTTVLVALVKAVGVKSAP